MFLSPSDFPPLPKINMRSRSASDPARLPSTINSEADAKIRELEEKLASIEHEGKTPPSASKAGAEKNRRTSNGVVRGVSAQQTGVQPNVKSAAGGVATKDPVNGVAPARGFESTAATNETSAKTPINGAPNSGVNGSAQKNGVKLNAGPNNSDRVTAKTAVNGLPPKPKTNGVSQKNAPGSKTTPSSPTRIKDISKLSPSELKRLSSPSVPHVKIAVIDLSRPQPQRKPRIIFNSYPLPLLLAISPRIAGILATRNSDKSRKLSTVSTASPPRITDAATTTSTSSASTTILSSPPAPTGMVLHTPSPTPLSLLLQHALLASQHASLTHPTPHSLLSIPLSECAFYEYARIVEEARYLGFTYLEKMVLARMRKVAGGQVHSDDVGRVLACDRAAACAKDLRKEGGAGAESKTVNEVGGASGAGKEASGSSSMKWLRPMIVTSIANALWERRLQYGHKYDELRREYPEFDGEIEEALADLDRQYGY